MLRCTWIDSHMFVFFVVVVNKDIYFEVIQLNSFSPKYLASDGEKMVILLKLMKTLMMVMVR